VVTYRAGIAPEVIDRIDPDLILISPGPGRPSDFGVADIVKHAAQRGLPVFGVCLGLQGIVEAFGGELGVLDYPMHGKASIIEHANKGVFEGLPERFKVGRYHSLFARRAALPSCLEITAETSDGVIMGVRHRELPIEGVQFHPESLLTLDGDCGLRMIRNVVAQAAERTRNPATHVTL
jgi:anthranilate synthase